MADSEHSFAKPEKWASAALGLLEREIVLAGLVSRDSGADFAGAKNDTVNIRRPSILGGVREDLRAMDAVDGSYAIVSEALNERSLAVVLSDHVYSAVDLSDAELSLDIHNFGAQVLTPQVKSIATRVEFMVAEKMNGLTATPVTGTAGENGVVRTAIINMRKALNKQDVPASGRVLVIGTDVEAQLLQDPNLIQADQSGTSSALRDAELGRLFGFRVVVSNTIDADRMVAFHPSAYSLVTRAPKVPEGAVTGSSESYAGVAMRAVKDYNSQVAKDRSLVSTFVGVGEVTDPAISYSKEGKPTVGEAAMVRAVATTVSITDPSS